MRPTFSLLSLWILLQAGLLGLGCAAPPRGPELVVRRYVAAVRADKPEVAYALLDDKTRQRVSLNQFVKRWRDSRKEILTQADELQSASGKRPRYTARLTFAKGTSARLVTEDGKWRIREPISVDLRASTPREALEAFIKAVESRDYRAVMRLTASSMRKTIEKEVNTRLKLLKKGLGREIEVTGNKARLQYDRRYWIELIREAGSWKIIDYE